MASISRNRSSGGILGHISGVFLQPRAFFYKLPHTRHWLFIAMLVMFVYAFNAANQQTSIQTFTESTSTQVFERTAPNATDNRNFDQSATVTTDDQTIEPPAFDAINDESTVLTTLTATTTISEDEPTLMLSLLAATDVLVIWTGQALLLSIVVMATGRMPNISRSFQIAVWASLPLVLMLIVRQLFFSAGGEGGSVGLMILLESWEGYHDLSIPMQQFLAIFASNLTLFWMWNMALLYFGARYALRGNRLLIVMVLVLWMFLSTGVMTFTTDPIVAIEPLPQTETEVETNSSSDTTQTTTTQTDFNNFGGGNFEPPTGGGGGPRN